MNSRTFLSLFLASLLVATTAAVMFPIQPAFAATVTVPINIGMRSGSSTPETVGVAYNVNCLVAGVPTNYSHDGNAATQNFTCDASTTVTVTTPADTATSRFRFATGEISKTFTSCASGTCSTTTYSNNVRQFLQNFIVSGLDSNERVEARLPQYGSTSNSAPLWTSNDTSLHFDGVDDTATVADTSSVMSNTAGTVAFWAFRETGVTRYWVQFSDTKPVIYMASSGWQMSWSGSTGMPVSSSNSNIFTFSSITWHHVAVTWNSTAYCMYLDATLQECDGGVTWSAMTSGIERFGSASASNFHQGNLDEIRFYNNYKTATEILNLKNGIHDTSGLVAYWKFNEGTGTTIADSVGGFNGNVTGPTWEKKGWVDQTGSTVMTISNPFYVRAGQERYETNSATTMFITSTNRNITLTYNKQYSVATTLSGIDATTVNKVTITSAGVTSNMPHNGGTNYKLSMDGINDYVQVNHNSAIDAGSVSIQSYSVALWFKTRAVFDQSLTEKWSAGTCCYPWAMRGPTGSGTISFNIYDGTNNPGCSTNAAHTPLHDNEWHLAVGVRNVATDTLYCYIDGSTNSASAGDTTTGTISNSQNMIIGARSSSAKFFEGEIDDVRFYNKALSTTEIDQLFTGIDVTSGLAAHYTLDEGSGSTAIDSSGNSNSGTLNNSPVYAQTFTDKNTNIVVADGFTVTADQERFKSYNSTAQRTINASALSISKTISFQKEFNTLFRVHETNAGTALPSTPTASFTGTIRTANGTNISATFSTKTTDNYLDTSSRIWISNGTLAMPNDLTWRGIVVNSTSRDYALTIDGGLADGATDIPNESDYDFERTSPHSIFVNMKTSAATVQYIVSKVTTSGTRPGYDIGINSTGQVFVDIGDTGSGSNRIKKTTVSAYNDGTYHKLAYTYSGSSTAAGLKLYVDGALASTTTNNDNAISTMLNDVQVGIGYRGNSILDFNGAIADVAIYNRELTADEITTLTNGGYVTSGLKGHWRFDENTGTRALDSSTEHNHFVFDEGSYVDTGATTGLGSFSIFNAYGTVDIEATSQHLGYETDKSFRYGVDQATSISNAFFEDDILSFNATSSGTRTAKVEFRSDQFVGIDSVKVDGTILPTSDWSITKIDDNYAVLTISNIGFSTKNIAIDFTRGTTSGGSGGGGGSGTYIPPVISDPGISPSELRVIVSVDDFHLKPGENGTGTIDIEITGSTRVTITSIKILDHAKWFTVLKSTPYPLTIKPGELSIKDSVPITAAIPDNVQAVNYPISAEVVAFTGITSTRGIDSFSVIASPQLLDLTGLVSIRNLVLAGIVAAIVGVAAVVAKSRK